MRALNSAYLLIVPIALVLFLKSKNAGAAKKNLNVKILSMLLMLMPFVQNVYSQWLTQTSGLTTYITSVNFINQSTGWAAGDQGKILKTTNGGANWIELATGFSNNLNGVQFLNENTGFASGTSTVLKTTNGGVNWQQYSTGVNVLTFFTNAITGYGIGAGGIIIKTTNSGANWITQISGTSEYLTDIFFVDDNTGYIDGFGGVILKTTNGGTNWINQVSGTGNEFVSIFFINSSTGWASGLSGNMRRTTNGGTNWILMTSPTDEDLLSVFFINNNTGWISGSNGKMLATTNGGTNWSFQTLPTSFSLNSVFFVGLSGWSTGNNGTIIATTTGGYAVGMPVLTSPQNNSTGISLTPQLQWNTVSGAANYRLQLSTDSNFVTMLINDSTLSTNSYSVLSGVLQNNMRYYWRVQAKNGNGSGLYSGTWNFNTSLTGISQINTEISGEFRLYNNYPNPFNPSTTIKFDLPKNAFTMLIVYDAAGREVKTLVNENLSAGTYSYSFNAEGLSSGIYFYRIEAGEFSNIKKMILVK